MRDIRTYVLMVRMRWSEQGLRVEEPSTLPGLARINTVVRSVTTPEFAGVTFHEILAKSALNKVPTGSGMPFGWTINPYRGCSHACVYCLSPDTLILGGDGRERPLRSIRVGDTVMGTRREGAYRRYTPATVTAVMHTRKRAFRVTLADGTELVASGDHRFLTDRGWKYVEGSGSGASRRPHVTLLNHLMGYGAGEPATRPVETDTSRDYRRGYLAGMIRGDGMMLRRTYTRANGRPNHVSAFRLALVDDEALQRSRSYLADEGVRTTLRPFVAARGDRRALTAIFTGRRADYDRISDLIERPADPTNAWLAGFLGGSFDAEGSCSRGILRLSNSDRDYLADVEAGLARFAIPSVREPMNDRGVAQIRLLGGRPVRARFFRTAMPAISRKLDVSGTAVKTISDLRIVSVEDLGVELDLIDITTTTSDFIANGVVSHNCFARPTHTYLDLNAGTDFDSQVIVKINVAEVLERELRKPSWQHHPVALGTNTDPYQRAEGRYELMPGIIRALASSGTPLSILTKGTLVRRDLPLLAEVAREVPVDLAMSIAIYDDELQKSIEPGTPSAAARLRTVTAVREAGLDCSVFLMPILPWLTDSTAHLDDALQRVKAAGGTSVLYSALHLKPGVKPWFMHWLERTHPELVPRYRELYAGGAYAPKAYRQWLAHRIRPLIRAHGLDEGREEPTTGGVRSSALGQFRDPDGERRPARFASEDRPTVPSPLNHPRSSVRFEAAEEPTLF